MRFFFVHIYMFLWLGFQLIQGLSLWARVRVWFVYDDRNLYLVGLDANGWFFYDLELRGSIMKYFTNWSVYTIKVVIPILRLIYIFLYIDPVFVSLIVSMIVSAARIFKVCPAIRQSQLLLCFFSIALQINN